MCVCKLCVCVWGREGWRRDDTVMHSVSLPGISQSSSKVRLLAEYKVSWTSSLLCTLSFSLSVGDLL